MSDGQKPVDKVRDIIEGYISKNSHLLAMERIHQNLWEEEREFTNWTEVLDTYLNYSWTNEEVREFAQLSKQIVEGSSELSESYFRIVEPENVDLKTIVAELDSSLYDAEADHGDRDGFQYQVHEGIIEGRYIYTDISFEVSHEGDVNEYITEGAINFRIIPEKSLLITESTRVVDVQKTKSYFKRATNLRIAVYADFTAYPDLALEWYNNFSHYFDQDTGGEGIKLHNIKKLDLYSPDENKQVLKDVTLEGNKLKGNVKLQNLLDDDWLPKGAVFTVMYHNQTFDVKFSGNSVMSYLKISDIRDFNTARNLMNMLRNEFLESLRKHD